MPTLIETRHEDLVWRVYYRNGAVLNEGTACEHEGGGPTRAHGWGCVDKSDVMALALVRPEVGSQVGHVDVEEGETPLFWRRRENEVDVAAGSQYKRTLATYFGIERADGSRSLFKVDVGEDVPEPAEE